MSQVVTDQRQPGSLFQRPREAEKREPGNEIEGTMGKPYRGLPQASHEKREYKAALNAGAASNTIASWSYIIPKGFVVHFVVDRKSGIVSLKSEVPLLKLSSKVIRMLHVLLLSMTR